MIMNQFYRVMSLSVFIIASLIISPAVSGKTIYVNDNLRVGVRAEPSSRVVPFSVVVTGMKLNVLDEADGYIKIETDKGETGWVKDIYVSETPPAVIQIMSLKKSYEEREQQLRVLEETAKVLELANQRMMKQIDELKEERGRLQIEKARSDYLLESDPSSRLWLWIVLGSLLITGAAFSSGMIWNRQQTMKRLGGLRI
ncbi:MAG: TIGR04211 family SH3 domain-containing protein [Gammaproteobacteria bacterium]|nr:TIGR04211 family SH3 domain-containing protein [Gammaproteobacteria bacterium]